jgi:predicted acylesterase/phospholipase RssA
VLKHSLPWSRSRALRKLALEVFKEAKFTDMKTPVGIVATHWRNERPLIFKSSVSQAHGRRSTFQPGFGVGVGDAVCASCSAYPFFRRSIVKTSNGDVDAGDGGFCANNPTLYAIADAVAALNRRPEDLRVLSVGVGVYPEPKRWGIGWLLRRWPGVPLLQKTLSTNTLSMEQLTSVLFRQVPAVRINDTFEKPEMATDLLEHNLAKLSVLYQQGIESFAKQEPDIRRLLGET